MDIKPILADHEATAGKSMAGTADQATNPRPLDPGFGESKASLPLPEPKNEEPRKRIPLASIPTTIIIGLLIAAIYLGGRIFTARSLPKPAPIHTAVPGPPSLTPVPVQADALSAHPPPVPAESAEKKASPPKPEPAIAVRQTAGADEDGLPMFQPRPGERYIQVGALDPDARDTRRFVEKLRTEGLDPHVAAGPTPALMRVLIGPFATIEALNEKKAQIENEGIDTFVREY